jgi:hypothetical protein
MEMVRWNKLVSVRYHQLKIIYSRPSKPKRNTGNTSIIHVMFIPNISWSLSVNRISLSWHHHLCHHRKDRLTEPIATGMVAPVRANGGCL